MFQDGVLDQLDRESLFVKYVVSLTDVFLNLLECLCVGAQQIASWKNCELDMAETQSQLW